MTEVSQSKKVRGGKGTQGRSCEGRDKGGGELWKPSAANTLPESF